MTYPAGRTADGTWHGTTAQRDAIGSSDNLQAGDWFANTTTKSFDQCITVDGADASTWQGGPQYAAGVITHAHTLAIDEGGSGGRVEVEADAAGWSAVRLKKTDAQEAAIELHSNGFTRWDCPRINSAEDLTIRRYNTSGVFQDEVIARESNHDWELPANVDAAGHLRSTFDGTALRVEKTDAAEQRFAWFSNGNVRWQYTHQSDERFELRRHNSSGVFQGDTFTVDPSTGQFAIEDELQVPGDLNHDGSNVGFYGTAPAAQSAAYTPTNVSTDRSYDANSTTLDEVADVLGTLIADLQAVGLIG